MLCCLQVDGLPPHLARSLIAAQLAHTDPAGAAAAAAAVAHADDADADASGGQMSGCVGVGQQAPERLQSNSNSDNTAVVTSQPRRTQGSGAGAGALGTDGQGDAATPDAATGPGAMSTPPAGGEQAAATAPAAGVQGRGSGPAPQAAPGGGPSGTAGGPQLLPTVSGDMLRSLLSKGRHALSAAHQQAGEQGSSWQAPLLAGHQQMHSELLALLGDALDEPISNALGALGAAPAAAAAAATTASGGARNTSAPAAGAHQQQPPHQHMRAADASGGAAGGMMLPAGYQFTTTANGHHMAGAGAFRGQQQQQQQEQQQQQQQQAVYNAAGSEFNGSNSNLPLPLPMPLLRRGSSSLGGPPSPLTALLGSSQGLAGAAAAAQGELPSWALNGSSQGLGGGGLRPMSAAMLAASHSQHNLNLLGGDFDGPDAFTMMGHMAPAPGTTNNGAGSGNVYHHLMQMSGPAMPAAARGSVGGGDAYGSGINGGAAGSGVHASLLHMYGDGYMRGQAAAQAAPPGYTAADVAAAAAAAHAAAAAAAAAGSGSGSQGGAVAGVGDKRRRGSGAGAGMGTAGSSSSGGGGAPDPRMACVKSVQYRVSRFPSELHDLCIEHWERARCARVVCNDVQVRSGACMRCVESWSGVEWGGVECSGARWLLCKVQPAAPGRCAPRRSAWLRRPTHTLPLPRTPRCRLIDAQGVLSVQSGRCVVTFNQGSSEVVKGVADYLRHAGEERIKKWRRHVRMVGE
jgi:hypothetical protein